MQKYVVSGRRAVIPGDVVMILNERQAADRKLFLKPAGKGKYRTIFPTEFKKGEEIGIIGEIKSKELAGKLEKITAPPATD